MAFSGVAEKIAKPCAVETNLPYLVYKPGVRLLGNAR